MSRPGAAAAMRGLLGLLSLLGVCLTLQGCTSVASLAATLNARQVQSCIYGQGGYGLFFQLRVITATGGLPLEACLAHR